MTEKKTTPTQRVKELEKQVKDLEAMIMKLNHTFGIEKAEYGNGQYSLGFAEGYDQAKIELAVQRADAGISRFFRK